MKNFYGINRLQKTPGPTEPVISEMKIYKHLLTVILAGGVEFDLPYFIYVNGHAVVSDSIVIDGMRIEAKFGESTVSDDLEIQGRMICVTRRWNFRGTFNARAAFSVLCGMTPEKWLVPGAAGFSGRGIAERMAASGEICEAHTTTPACGMVCDREKSLSIFTRPASTIDDLGSIVCRANENNVEMTILTPGELPGSVEGFDGWEVSEQATYERRFYVIPDAAAGMIENTLSAAWGVLAFPAELHNDWSAIVGAKTHYLMDEFFIERRDAIGFTESAGLHGFPSEPRLNSCIPGGNIEAARAVYIVGAMLDDRELKRVALDTVDFFLAEYEKSNLPGFVFDLPRKRWQKIQNEKTIIRNTGLFLAAATRLRACVSQKDMNPRWLSTLKKIADDVIRSYSPGRPGDDFESAIPEGAEPPFGWRSAASFVLAFSALFTQSGERKYLSHAEWLAGRLVLSLPEIQTPPASAKTLPSRNDAHLLMRAFLSLHTASRRAEYLNAATQTATLIRSMTYCFKVPLPPGAILHSKGFNSTGGVPPAYSADHLDCYPAAIATDMFSLWKLTGDDTWRDLASVMLEFSFQPINLSRGLSLDRLLGASHPENFFHCPHENPTGKWGAVSGNSSWAQVVSLAAVLDISAAFPGIINVAPEAIKYSKPQPGFISNLIKLAGSYLNFFA